MEKASNNKQVTIEEIKKACNHVGMISAPAQSILITGGDKLLVIATTSCNRCGHLFTNLNPVDLGAGGGGLVVATPKLDPKDFLDKHKQ